MPRRIALPLLSAVSGLVLVAGLGATPAAADGPPAPGPYGQLNVEDVTEGPMVCRDTDGAMLYEGSAWTLEPLVRGPLFAPVTLFLRDVGNVPVVPLKFTLHGGPVIWQPVPVTGTGGGVIDSASGRPVAYGPAATDNAPQVTCRFTRLGYFELGTYLMTQALVRMLGMPESMVGRKAYFDNEGYVEFSTPRYLFPLTASVVRPTLPTPDLMTYDRSWLPTMTCRSGSTVSYRGAAYTLSPLVRGYQWAPIAFWLSGDRIVTPQWFESTVLGHWRTADNGVLRGGELNVTTRDRPRGVGGRPDNATAGYDCAWSGEHHVTVMVGRPLAAQLGLPADVVGRRVELTGTYATHAYIPQWLFPPRA